ncbi:MAG TPA: metallophosphoesterase [Planktothrix sp.]|jgi:predicted MPP superfamily phosphohydrolase
MKNDEHQCSCGNRNWTSFFKWTRDFLLSPVGKTLGLAAGGLFVVGAGAFFYGTQIETRRWRLETIDITTGGAEPGGNGNGNGNGAVHHPETVKRTLRVLHLSDIHLHADDDQKAAFLQKITDDDYDIVVLTGDVFENFAGIQYVNSLLVRKPRIGAFAVLGNHDYYDYRMWNKLLGRIVKRFRHGAHRDVSPMINALQGVGYTVLQNEKAEVPEHKLFVIGIDWPGIAERALMNLASQAQDDQFKLVLFHLPKNLEFMQRAGAHLAVGGHTHGGQVRIPGYGALITESELSGKEASGLLWRGSTAFHISRGLGADPKTNIRFFCPPAATVLNITHYELAKAPR